MCARSRKAIRDILNLRIYPLGLPVNSQRFFKRDGEAMMNEAFATIESRFLKRIENASIEDLEDIERALEILQAKLFYSSDKRVN